MIAAWDYSGSSPGLVLIKADGGSHENVYPFDELGGDHFLLNFDPTFSQDGRYLLFFTHNAENDHLNYLVYDIQSRAAKVVYSFPVEHIVLEARFMSDNETVLLMEVDYQEDLEFYAMPANILRAEVNGDGSAAPFTAGEGSVFLEATLPGGELLVSQSSDGGESFERAIYDIEGKKVRVLDIDVQVDQFFGQEIVRSPYNIDPVVDKEGRVPPKAVGEMVYFKRCAKGPNTFTCSVFQADMLDGAVREVHRSEGESVFDFDVSQDNARLAVRQCLYIDAFSNVGRCTLRGIDIASGEILFEIRNGAYPAWSPDGQYLVYLDRIITGGYLQSSKLMRMKWDGSEVVELLPGNERVGDPEW